MQYVPACSACREHSPTTFHTSCSGCQARRSLKTVAVLFARADSVYKTLPGTDVWDFERDALKWPGGAPVVAHPPCRSWGRYSHWAKPREGERELALWAIAQVRQFGGVLEHPITSALWREGGCGSIGVRDQHGGVLVPVFQSWWGHRAPKQTGLYIVGPVPELPYAPMPEKFVPIENMCRAERERTPPALAAWLVKLARNCRPAAQRAAAQSTPPLTDECVGHADSMFQTIPEKRK